MCGIVGLFAKSSEVEEPLGVHLAAMLEQMPDRGPDSAGVAVYRDPAPEGWSKLTLYAADPTFEWAHVAGGLARGVRRSGAAGGAREVTPSSPSGRLEAEAWVCASRPDLRVMSAGESIEIYKETGRPEGFAHRSALVDFPGTHGLGHTRMATESQVTTAGSHPFSTGLDLCLVHNGSLSNHNRLREILPQGDLLPDRERQRGRGWIPRVAA